MYAAAWEATARAPRTPRARRIAMQWPKTKTNVEKGGGRVSSTVTVLPCVLLTQAMDDGDEDGGEVKRSER